jgi:N-acetylneuraminic acid mutarotase
VATLFSVVTEVLLLPAAIPAIAQQKQRSPFMKVPFRKLFSVVILAAFSLALAACGGNSAPSSFTISGTVVNLAGTGGGLVLQDNLNDALPVNANGSFTFAKTVASGSLYSVTISAQPSNPTQTCGVTNGSGTATANVTNLQVNCGHNEWAWVNGPSTPTNNGVYGTLGVAAASNFPGGRQTPTTWTDTSGNLWLFGGFGLDSVGSVLPMNDLWRFGAGQWTWMGGSNSGGHGGTYGTLGVPAMSNIPGARSEAVGWTDAAGNFWLFGGNGFDSAGDEGSLNDLWKYSAGEWTWMGGSDLTVQQGIYGMLDVPSANNIPGSRFGAVSWIDSAGNFWLFGGISIDSNGRAGQLNDLWKYTNGEWTWESGSNVVDQEGTYGTQGTPAPGNVPGARDWAVSWIDSSGSLWVFGGVGFDSTGVIGILNDLWKFSNGQWTWMSGSSLANQAGVYGTRGMPSPVNVPGYRQLAISWTDSSGNFWLFGGNGVDSASGVGLLNDLWKYSNGEWTWMSGSNLINQNGVYGTQGVIAPGNIPGARLESSSWIDANGNLWLFGGYGEPASGTEGNLSDLWMYTP